MNPILRRGLMPAAAFLLLTLASCKKNAADTTTAAVSTSDIDRIKTLGYSTENMQSVNGGYVVEGDIFLAKEDLTTSATGTELIFGQEEHYRTSYVVNRTSYPTIKIALNNSSTAHQAVFSAAVDEAIRRFTAAGITLKFQRVASGANVTVNAYYEASNTLGYSGFPNSAGAPYPVVKMNTYWYSTSTVSTNVNYIATVIAHEIGHCIGFRHTDYMNRAYSCGGTAVNEGSAGVGAVYIPGTSTGPKASSWMLACIGNQVNRPFTDQDLYSLRYLYR
jgi:hypothetical protein